MNQLYSIFVVMIVLSSSVLAEPDRPIDGFTEPTFRYSQVELKLGRVDLDDEFIVLGDRYNSADAAEFSYSHQVHQNLFIAGQFNTFDGKESRSEISQTYGSLFFGMPLDASERVDLVPTLGIGRVDQEACIDHRCVSNDDTAVVFGSELRIFVIPNALELSIGVNDNTFEDTDPYFTISVAGWAATHHRVSLEYTDAKGIKGYGLGYSYNW